MLTFWLVIEWLIDAKYISTFNFNVHVHHIVCHKMHETVLRSRDWNTLVNCDYMVKSHQKLEVSVSSCILIMEFLRFQRNIYICADYHGPSHNSNICIVSIKIREHLLAPAMQFNVERVPVAGSKALVGISTQGFLCICIPYRTCRNQSYCSLILIWRFSFDYEITTAVSTSTVGYGLILRAQVKTQRFYEDSSPCDTLNRQLKLSHN